LPSVTSRPKFTHPVETFTAPIVGLPAWEVKRGYGSFLTFDFGEPRLKLHEWQAKEGGLRRSAYVTGAWRLWIYCCNWKALDGNKQLASSEDTDDIISKAADSMNGQKLLRVSVDPGSGRSTIAFDLGGSLETWPYDDGENDKQWMILTETEVFAYRADGQYMRDPIDTKPSEERWLPIC
jgi:hypothetical protein